MLRIVVLLPLFLFLCSMACMGQTFQYSRGWTNGKRAGTTTTANTLHQLFHKDDDGFSELFEVQDANERRLERCILQLQRFIRNPLLLHPSSAAAALGINPSLPTGLNGYGNANGNGNSNGNNNNNMNNNPYDRNHQSSELFEELGAGSGAVIDTNDYGKH